MKSVSSRTRSKCFMQRGRIWDSKPCRALKEGFTSQLHRELTTLNNDQLIGKHLGSIRLYSAAATSNSTHDPTSKDIKGEWIIDRPLDTGYLPQAYYVGPDNKEEISPREILHATYPKFHLITGADGSGKTTRLIDFKYYAEARYPVICLPVPLPLSDDPKAFWNSIYRAIQPTPKDLEPFSHQHDFISYLRGFKEKFYLLIDDIDRLATTSPDLCNDFFRALSIVKDTDPQVHAVATGTWGVRGFGVICHMSSFNESLNDLNSTRIPHFSRSQVENLFDKFQNDDHFVLDPNVVGDIWLRSGGHPATVCLCGQSIRDRLPVLLDDQTRHVSFTAWKCCTVQELYQWIGLNPAYKRMLQAFPPENPDSDRTILFLSYRFFGSLDPVRILPDEVYFAESLMAKGVLTGTRPNYRIASAFVDSFLRKTLLTARFPKRPDDAPPVIDEKIDALDAIKKATRCFDWGLLYHSDGAPLRQGLYDTELARILMNWMNTSEGWSATSDWHSGTIGMHSYIIIKKGIPPAEHTIVIAVLATRDAAFAHLRLLGLIEYKELMGADEAWLVQYSREDDFRKIWRSYDPLEKGVNVVYFQHGVYFPRNKMSARWKDAQGHTHKILKEASKVSVIPESRL